MKRIFSKSSFNLSFLLILILLAGSGCTQYRTYNSLHWAKEAYRQGKQSQGDEEKRRRQNPMGSVTPQPNLAGAAVTGSQFFEEAARKCLSFLSTSPKGRRTDDALMLMGESFLELRRYVQAENSFRTLLDTQQKSKFRDDAQYYLIMIMLQRKEIGQAEMGIENLLDLYPKSKFRPIAQYQLGQKLFEVKEYQRALEVLFGVKDNYPKFQLKGDVLSSLARIYFELQDYEKSLALYKQLEKEGKNDLLKREGLIGMARCKSRMGNHQESLDLYQLALNRARFPDDRAEASLGINVEYTYLDRAAEAKEGFGKVITDIPRSQYSAAAWYETGLLYKTYREHFAQDSIVLDSVALKVFALGSERLKQMNGLSQTLLSLKLSETAFTNVRKDDPNSPLAKPADRQIADVRDLYSIFEQIEASDSTSSQDALARLEFLLAEHNENAGQIELAKAGYERLIFEYPNTIWVPKAALNAARLNLELGDSLRYKQSVELVLNNFPDTRYADQARMMLSLPVPERPEGFYLDELAAYAPPRIVRAAAAASGAGAAAKAGRAVIGKETYSQMRRRLYWAKYGKGGGA